MPRGVYPRKRRFKKVSWKGRKPNPKDPPRIKLVVNLPARLAINLIEAAEEEGKTVSKFLTELLSGDYK